MNIDFKKSNGLVPAIVQDASTNKVLMLGYMNEEAYEITKAKGLVTFFSRTRNTLWTKGETSGNFLTVQNILLDCDQDTLLIKAIPQGPVCHTGADTCFNEENEPAKANTIDFLIYLENVIKGRQNNPQEGSYTNHLFSKGVSKIAQKVGEEAVELVIEAMRNKDELFLGEAADLLYHYLVLLTQKDFELSDVIEVLKIRHSR